MRRMTDLELLQAYASEGSQSAFTQLVAAASENEPRQGMNLAIIYR
jgi:hypothetical protein